MSFTKNPLLLAFLSAIFLVCSVHGQPANLVLEDTTIASSASFIAQNSIGTGPNFTIASSGDVTFTTGKYVYLKPGTTIIRGGKLKVIVDTTIVSILPEELPELPQEFALQQNYPNPFNPSTTIAYALQAAAFVSLKIYDVLGKEVKTLVNERQNANAYHIHFDASDLAGGVYYYRLTAGGQFVETKKMTLLK